MARIPNHLILRNGVFAYRRRVPAHLRHRQEFQGRDVFQVSLGVRSLTEAREQVHLRGLDRLFAPSGVPLAANDGGTVVTPALLRQVATENYRAGVDWLLKEEPGPVRDHQAELAAQDIGALNNPSAASDANARLKLSLGPALRAQAEGIASRLGIDPTEDAIQKIEAALFQSEKALIGARVNVAGGDPFPTWNPGGGPAAMGDTAPAAREAHWTFKKLSEAALRQHRPGESWAHKVRTVADLFEEYLGTATPIYKIDRRKVREFVNDLSFMPRSMSLRFPGLTLREAITANDARERPFPVVSPNTVRDGYFSIVRWVLNHAVELEALPVNPTNGVKVSGADKGKRATRKALFKVDELNALFRQPVFTGCQSDLRPNTPGDMQIDDHRKWAPLILLFSGARISEVAQLAVADVRTEGAVHFLSVLTEHDPDDPDDFVVSQKTANARREIPIHPELIELGFLDYVAARRAARDVRLFPRWELPKDRRKLYSGSPWVRNLNDRVIPAVTARRPKPTLYSFRHTWKTQMAIHKVPPQYQNQILGHAQTGMDEHYMHDLGVQNLFDAIKDIRYKDLDLEHLKY